MIQRTDRRTTKGALAIVAALLLAACGGDGNGDGDGNGNGGTEEVGAQEESPEAGGDDVEITLAHSYTEDQPQHRCGAQVIAEEMAAADVGVTVEVFGNSQLGGDAERITSVASGDIDMDIQGASALGALYGPMSVVDAAFAFDDSDHLARFFASDDSAELTDGFLEETGVRTLGAWSAGARHFTADVPIRGPEDLDGLRMRFPNSPQFLMNAEALGAQATDVAYEELYLALQQGTVDGQENPIVNIAAQNLGEVQDYISMSGHQANSNLVVIGPIWDELSGDQQDALSQAVDTAVAEVPRCVEESETETLEAWEESGEFEVIDDVDVDAFRSRAEEYLRENLTEDQVSVYDAIRGSSEG